MRTNYHYYNIIVGSKRFVPYRLCCSRELRKWSHELNCIVRGQEGSMCVCGWVGGGGGGGVHDSNYCESQL